MKKAKYTIPSCWKSTIFWVKSDNDSWVITNFILVIMVCCSSVVFFNPSLLRLSLFHWKVNPTMELRRPLLVHRAIAMMTNRYHSECDWTKRTAKKFSVVGSVLRTRDAFLQFHIHIFHSFLCHVPRPAFVLSYSCSCILYSLFSCSCLMFLSRQSVVFGSLHFSTMW